MMLSASNGNSLIIEEDDIWEAISLLEATEASFPEGMKGVEATSIANDMQKVRFLIEKHQPIDYSPLLRRVAGRRMSASQLQEILTALLEQEDIVEKTKKGKRGPIRTFSIKDVRTKEEPEKPGGYDE